jgi:3-oxoacyl-[acyl-carrier-protein] synthase II
MKRRVVITGMGVVSPLGLDAPSTWDALLAGTSGVGPITKFDAEGFSSRIAGEVRGFDAENYLDRRDVRKMDSFTHYAVAASR